jgi:hypothetical protein
MIEFSLNLDAEFKNPLDTREITVDAKFEGPDGSEWLVPGFWEAENSWIVRFTPSKVGAWDAQFVVKDRNGASLYSGDHFTVTPSGQHGWLQVGNWVDPSYNPRYLVYHDGTPFYGIGHCNAFDLSSFGFDPDTGFRLFDLMESAGENILVYWPLYSNPFFSQSFDKYSLPDLKVIDLILADAERKGIRLIFTIWNHDLLRDDTHPWSENNMGVWKNLNGFNKLVSIDEFFIDDEAWAWQENLYRYIIARWGYSPSIGMWQTISEIDGTNVGKNRDRFHKKINHYFVKNDPYRHPTTASMAGDRWWSDGFKVMDVQQMHSYDSKNDTIRTGPLIAEWTQKMSLFQAKPNFIGEFGTPDQRNQPEHLHNALWAALASGAAITPMDWNDGGRWGRMTIEMYQQMKNFSRFILEFDLTLFDSSNLIINTSSRDLLGAGISSGNRAIVWVQDISQIDKDITEIRENIPIKRDGFIEIEGLPGGTYEITPYDTWKGEFLNSYIVTSKSEFMKIQLPNFVRDIAFRVQLTK